MVLTALLLCVGGIASLSGGAAAGSTPREAARQQPPQRYWDKSFGQHFSDLSAGVVMDGFVVTVATIGHAAVHPFDTAAALGRVGLLGARVQFGDPSAYMEAGQLGALAWNGFQRTWNENPDRVIGRIGFEIATGAILHAKVGKGTKLAGDVAEASRGARNAGAVGSP